MDSVAARYSFGEDVPDDLYDLIFEHASHLLLLGGLDAMLYFYLDQSPSLLPTYLDGAGDSTKGRDTHLIFAVTSILIITGHFIQCRCPSIWVYCATS